MALGDQQDPITAADPRVQRVLAMLQGQGTLPNYPNPQALGPVPNAPAPPLDTTATPSAGTIAPVPMATPVPSAQAANIPAQPPGPIKSFLQGLVSNLGGAAYQGTQGALQRLGIPTDYEKQQNAAKLDLQQQAQNSLESYRTSEGNRQDALTAATNSGLVDYQIPNDPRYGSIAGTTLPRGVAVPLMQKMDSLANAKDIASGKVEGTLALEQLKQAGGNPRDHVIRSVGGDIGLYNKRDGSLVKSLGTDTSTLTPVIRAKANAQYAAANVMDDAGNPTAVSRLTQLATGAPTMTEKATQTLAGDKLGAVTYLSANSRVERDLPVLQDEVQRGIIARATQEVERNPGAIDSIINSSLQDGLSPQGADLIAAMKQMNEFGSTFKKYTGNGGSSTDSLRATIQSNQPSTANSLAVNQQLLKQDRALATGVLTNLSRPGNYTVPSRTTPAPVQAFTDAGVLYHIPAGQVAEFKKDHPNAR